MTSTKNLARILQLYKDALSISPEIHAETKFQVQELKKKFQKNQGGLALALQDFSIGKKMNLNRTLVSPDGRLRLEVDQTTPEAIETWDTLVKLIHKKMLKGYKLYNADNKEFYSFRAGIAYYK